MKWIDVACFSEMLEDLGGTDINLGVWSDGKANLGLYGEVPNLIFWESPRTDGKSSSEPSVESSRRDPLLSHPEEASVSQLLQSSFELICWDFNPTPVLSFISLEINQ